MNQLRSIIARACVTQLRHTTLSRLTKQQLIIQLLMHMIHYVPNVYQNQPVEHDSKNDAVDFDSVDDHSFHTARHMIANKIVT